MSAKDKFGTRLKAIRNKHNLTQSQFAEKLGVSRASISAYETGNRIPDIEFLDKVSICFDATLNFLFGRSSFKNAESKKDDIKRVINYIEDYSDEEFFSKVNYIFLTEFLMDDEDFILWDGIEYVLDLCYEMAFHLSVHNDNIKDAGKKFDINLFSDIYLFTKTVNSCLNDKINKMCSDFLSAICKNLQKHIDEEDNTTISKISETYSANMKVDEMEKIFDEYDKIRDRLYETNEYIDVDEDESTKNKT